MRAWEKERRERGVEEEIDRERDREKVMGK